MSDRSITNSILTATKNRRSIRGLKPELPTTVSIDDVQAIVQTIIKDSPTAHNSQGNRAIILTGETHKNVWNHVVETIPIEPLKKRPAGIRDQAFGSIIFFEDDKTLEKLQKDDPRWADAFIRLNDHSSGAAQVLIWTALDSMGLGCHLQHYNDFIRQALPGKVPAEWSVVAQLCFGIPDEVPGEKIFIDNDVIVFN